MFIAGFQPVLPIFSGKFRETQKAGMSRKNPRFEKRWIELNILGYGNIGAGITNP